MDDELKICEDCGEQLDKVWIRYDDKFYHTENYKCIASLRTRVEELEAELKRTESEYAEFIDASSIRVAELESELITYHEYLKAQANPQIVSSDSTKIECGGGAG